MTKQEVIKILSLIKSTVFLGNRKFLDALDRAIELLKQPEPCEDTISRQNAIELAMQYCPDDDGTCSKADEDIRNLLDELENLPSAQPDWNEMIVICDCCGHAIHVKRQ